MHSKIHANDCYMIVTILLHNRYKTFTQLLHSTLYTVYNQEPCHENENHYQPGYPKIRSCQ